MSKMIPMDECVQGRVYRLHSRNLHLGVYDGNGGFIGIRRKWADRYLFTEYHFDQGRPHGTVRPMVDLVVRVPEEMPISCESKALFEFLDKLQNLEFT